MVRYNSKKVRKARIGLTGFGDAEKQEEEARRLRGKQTPVSSLTAGEATPFKPTMPTVTDQMPKQSFSFNSSTARTTAPSVDLGGLKETSGTFGSNTGAENRFNKRSARVQNRFDNKFAANDAAFNSGEISVNQAQTNANAIQAKEAKRMAGLQTRGDNLESGKTAKMGAKGQAVAGMTGNLGGAIANAGGDGKDYTHTKKEATATIGGSVLQGAAMGSMGGPWGAAAGAVVGLVTGLISNSKKKKEASKVENRMNKQQMEVSTQNAMADKIAGEGETAANANAIAYKKRRRGYGEDEFIPAARNGGLLITDDLIIDAKYLASKKKV